MAEVVNRSPEIIKSKEQYPYWQQVSEDPARMRTATAFIKSVRKFEQRQKRLGRTAESRVFPGDHRCASITVTGKGANSMVAAALHGIDIVGGQQRVVTVDKVEVFRKAPERNVMEKVAEELQWRVPAGEIDIILEGLFRP